MISSTNKIDTDDESRGHIEGDDSSDPQPLGMKNIDDHGVRMARNELTTDIYPKEDDLDQANQNEPARPFFSLSRTTTAMSFEAYKPRHRYMYAACVCIAAVSIIGLLATAVRTMVQSPLYPIIDDERDAGLASPACPQRIPIQIHNHLDPMNYLYGPPTERFRGPCVFRWIEYSC